VGETTGFSRVEDQFQPSLLFTISTETTGFSRVEDQFQPQRLRKVKIETPRD